MTLLLKIHTFFVIGAVCSIIRTDSVHPVHALALTILAGMLGWIAFGSYQLGLKRISKTEFVTAIGLSGFVGAIVGSFLPLDNFIQLLIACAILGTVCQKAFELTQAGFLGMLTSALSSLSKTPPPVNPNPQTDEDSEQQPP